MPRSMHDSEQPRPGAESEVSQKQETGEQSQEWSANDQDYLSRNVSQSFEDANRRPLDKMFNKPGKEVMNLDNARLVDNKILSLAPDKNLRDVQAHLTKLYEQQLDKVLAANEPTKETRDKDRIIGRGLSIDQRWEQKKQFFKDLLSAHVERQWAGLESQNLQTKEGQKAYEAKILQGDHEKLKSLGIEHASLNEKAASAKDMPVEITFNKGFNNRIGKAPEIRISPASKEKTDFGRQVLDLGHKVYELGRQIEDAQREGTGFLGSGKKKKEQKIASLEQQKAGLEAQKQEAEKSAQQEKLNERAIKEVSALVKKVNDYEFSSDNFKTDKLAETKTLGQFAEALNAEIQRLGQLQPSPEQAAGQRLIYRSEQRVQQAEQQLKNLEDTRQNHNYRDMRSDTLSSYY